jgi:regulator of sigma E protease
LGGYVKIAGMVDESMDKEQLKQPAQDWEFRSKPAWQRLIIMLGGIIVNVLLAFVIYSMILMVWGEKNIKADSLKYGVAFNDPLFKDLGFQNGDKIIAVDGKPVVEFTDILKKILLVDSNVTVIRNGQQQNLKMPVDLIGKLIEKRKK